MSAGGTLPERIAPLLLEQLEPGTRVRADGDVVYVTEDLEIPDGAEGTVDRSWGIGLSFVRWDIAPARVVATSHDSLEIAELNAHGEHFE